MVLFDSITGAIYGPNTNGVTGYVARAVAPEVSFRIGQYFKENHGEGTAPHILAHGILAAAVSVATGNDPTTGALSAMGAEAGAKHVADYLYPGIRLSDLTAEQKATVSSITSLAGLGIGASTSDVGSAVSAGETAKSAVENNNAIILHGGAFGKPEGVLGLKNTIAKLMFNNDLSKVSNPKIDYDNEYLLLVNSGPQPGVTLAENFQHLQNSPKVVAGYSVGGDAALRVGSPNGGGKWDLRVIAGARIDNVDFVNKLIQASQNSKKVIVINIVGDRNLSNDIRIANNDIYPITSSFGSQFGDRSYLALEQAINSQFGSIKNFETKYPNISIQPSFGPHGGGGNAVDTQNALIKGFTQLSNRGIK